MRLRVRVFSLVCTTPDAKLRIPTQKSEVLTWLRATSSDGHVQESKVERTKFSATWMLSP